MASFILTWVPSVTEATNQVVQYKTVAAGSWSNFATVSPEATTIEVTGLAANTSYQFRIKCNCANGGVLYSGVVTSAVMTCPTPTLTFNGIAVTSSFVPAAVSTYKVQLYKNGVYTTQIIYNSPFANPLVTTFSGLTVGNNYQVKIISIFEGIEKKCPISSVIPYTCQSITNVTGTIS